MAATIRTVTFPNRIAIWTIPNVSTTLFLLLVAAVAVPIRAHCHRWTQPHRQRQRKVWNGRPAFNLPKSDEQQVFLHFIIIKSIIFSSSIICSFGIINVSTIVYCFRIRWPPPPPVPHVPQTISSLNRHNFHPFAMPSLPQKAHKPSPCSVINWYVLFVRVLHHHYYYCVQHKILKWIFF